MTRTGLYRETNSQGFDSRLERLELGQEIAPKGISFGHRGLMPRNDEKSTLSHLKTLLQSLKNGIKRAVAQKCVLYLGPKLNPHAGRHICRGAFLLI